MSKGMWRWFILIGLLLVFLGAALVLRAQRNEPLPALPPMGGNQLSATLINDSQTLPSFSLARVGSPFTNADLLDHWTLMFFGYTHCPDVCLTSLTAMKDMQKRLLAAGVIPPQVVFVSVDPERDTPERMAEFVGFFDPSFIGATANESAMAPLVKNLGVHYQRVEGQSKDHYTMDHSTTTFLVDPRGRLKAVFSWPHDPQAMAEDYPKIIAN